MADPAQMDPTLESRLIRDPTLESIEDTDCRLDFAHDVFNEVYPWITGVYPPYPKTVSPVNPTFKLLAEHKDYIEEFLEEDGSKLKKFIVNSRGEKPWVYDDGEDGKYQKVKSKIVKKYKKKEYSEKGFVRLCAAVAFATIGNQSLQENKFVVDTAAGELHEFILEVLKPGGNIHHSEWAEEVTEDGSDTDLEPV